MSLEMLPDEILVIIIKLLDIKSIHNLHAACDRFRTIIRTYGPVKLCNLSLSVMATAKTLQSTFFNDISRNIQELNLCAVCDLNKTVMLRDLKKLRCLKVLNITYTNITLLDFIEIYKVCPTINDISIDFKFPKSLKIITEPTLSSFQEVFKGMINVHFVGGTVLICCETPAWILKDAKLKKLQFTIIDTDSDIVCVNLNQLLTQDVEPDSSNLNYTFDNFILHMTTTNFLINLDPHPHCNQDTNNVLNWQPFSSINLENYEAIIIPMINEPNVVASPIFESFLDKFKFENLQYFKSINFKIINDNNVYLCQNGYVMLWNKGLTNFDEKFFSRLWSQLKPCFPCHFDFQITTPVPPNYDLYITTPNQMNAIQEQGFKRKRVASNCVINLDTAFQEKSKVQLCISFGYDIRNTSVSLSSNCNFLKKLTFLNLSGPVRYSADFFQVLFKCCDNLTTLSVKGNSFYQCSAAIAKSLHFSSSIKNIQLIDRDIPFALLFTNMSKCTTLENIHIFDKATSPKFTNPSVVIEKCVNLYCMYIFVNLSPSFKKKQRKMLRNLNKNKRIVKLFSNNILTCNPYSDVFKLNVWLG